MSTKKIKSIKIIKDFPSNNLPFLKYEGKELESRIDPDGKFMSWNVENYPEYFEIEYEKPQILKRPDGSVISGLEEGMEVILVHPTFTKSKELVYEAEIITYFACNHLFALKEGKIFLPEDIDLAEKTAKQLTKQLEIRNEIDRLNAEQGWEPDWDCLNEENKKYFLAADSNQRIISRHSNFSLQSQHQYMSEKTAETILAKYTQEELQQYLRIII